MAIKFPQHASGFLRVAAAVPELRVADPQFNTDKILRMLTQSECKGAELTVFPELSITGYTAGDLFFQQLLQEQTLIALRQILRKSRTAKPIFVVGAPLAVGGKLYNAAMVIHRGVIQGIVPKIYIPGYKEFYEERWFASGRDLPVKEIPLFGRKIPIGTDLLFKIGESGATFGIEVCEDLWVPLPPSSFQALAGANLILNPSASNELVGKAEYRRNLILQQSARAVAGYVYTSAGVHESTTDIVFGGHALIAENGLLLNESNRFKRSGELVFNDIDLEHVAKDRERMTSFGEIPPDTQMPQFRTIKILHVVKALKELKRTIDPHPFVPPNQAERDTRAKEIFSIQVAALAKRLQRARIYDIILGLSGGLDSTLALLVALKTAEILKISNKHIHAYSMPGFGTSDHTRGNAQRLAKTLGVSFAEIDIRKGVSQQFSDIQHDGKKQDLVFENSQARYRTLTLMSKANQMHGLVLGTGDLSEVALGWNTFSGDHIAHYNVNCGIPKTLVRYLVQWVAETQVEKKTRAVLEDILKTPISPELKKTGISISHKTEEIIGPYELHDFFLYHFLRWGSSPKKILVLARAAWGKKYSDIELKKWLRVFLERFFNSQWKRSVAVDGPKVGSVSLSPRGDWRMPSDAEVEIWLKDLG